MSWILTGICFEKPGLNIDDIEFEVKTEQVRNKPHGVTLEISGLKSRWNTESIERLKDELGVYIATGKDGSVNDIKIRMGVKRCHAKDYRYGCRD